MQKPLSMLFLCNRIEIALLDDSKQDNSKIHRASNCLYLLELVSSKVQQTPSLQAIASSSNYPPDHSGKTPLLKKQNS